MADNKLYLHNIDLATNELLNARMQPVTTAVRNALASNYNSGDEGILVYDIDLDAFFVWGGNQWAQATLSPTQLAQLQAAYDNIITGITVSPLNPEQAMITLSKLNAVPITYTYERAYIHNQTSPASTWTVAHNLNKYPSVSVVDSAYEEVIGEVEYLTPNTLEVRFTAPFSGQAYIN
jgi:hypothetical protein